MNEITGGDEEGAESWTPMLKGLKGQNLHLAAEEDGRRPRKNNKQLERQDSWEEAMPFYFCVWNIISVHSLELAS